MAFLNTILLTELILRTYRTTERKHKYIHQMMARNFDDKTTLLNTNFTHGINTENVQDSREETHVQIYLPNDRARNLEEAKNAEVARVISAFLKKLLMQIKSKLNSKL